jgi:hypothetical protein
MKTIKNLDTVLKTVHGKEYVSETGNVRFILVDALGAGVSIKGDEKIRAFNLAMKIRECKEDSLEIEDQDMDILKKCIDEQKFIVQVYAQAMAALE